MLELPHEFVDHWYHSPSSLEKSGGIFLIRAGHNHAKPNYHVGPKFVVYHSVHFVIRGTVKFKFADNAVILNAGDVFCLYPYDTYEYSVHLEGLPNDANAKDNHLDDHALEMYWLAFDGVQSEAILRRIGVTRNHPYASCTFSTPFVDTLHMLAEAWKHSDASDLHLLGLTYLVFSQLCKDNSTRLVTGSDMHWTVRSLEYMDMHFMDGISVADVAKLVGVHRSHFTKEFTKELGFTPSAYLQRLKMEKAKEMLASTSYSGTEIALSLNFSDLYSFTRAFKQYHGTAPSHYRRKLRQSRDSSAI